MTEPLAPVLQVVADAMKAEGIPEAKRRDVIARLLATALSAASLPNRITED